MFVTHSQSVLHCTSSSQYRLRQVKELKLAKYTNTGKLFRLAYRLLEWKEVPLRVLMSFLLLAGLLSAGCQANTVDAEAPLEASSSPIAEPVTADSGDPQMTPSPPVDAGLRNLIDKAINDLANRLSISAAEISLLEATSVVWPDASLGCPQPGMMYIQVPEDGLLIRLQAGDQVYEYHSGGIREPFLCEKSGKDPNPPPQIDIFNLTPSSPKSTPDSSITPDNGIPPGENQ